MKIPNKKGKVEVSTNDVAKLLVEARETRRNETGKITLCKRCVIVVRSILYSKIDNNNHLFSDLLRNITGDDQTIRNGQLADVEYIQGRYESCADNTTANGLRTKVDQSRMSISRGGGNEGDFSLPPTPRSRVRLKIHIIPLGSLHYTRYNP